MSTPRPTKRSRDHVLSPLVDWTVFESDKLLLRLPNGEQLTFDRDAKHIDEALHWLSAPASEGDASARPSLPDASLRQLYELLAKHRVLVPADAPAPNDWLRQYIELSAASTYRTGYAAKSCKLCGSGWLMDRARTALASVGIDVIDDDGGEDTLVVALADVRDHRSFRQVNEHAIARCQRVTFITRDGVELHTGPLVVPKQSACYECYYQRLMQHALYPADEEAYQAFIAERRERGGRAESALADGLAEFLILRHVTAAFRDLTAIVAPGDMQRFDVITLQYEERHVLKLPRCKICGRRAGKPEQAIRERAS